MSLTTQVEHYAGSATNYTTTVTQGLSDGVIDVVTKVIALRPDLAQYFAQMTTVTDGTGLSLDFSLPVLFVSRDGYPCIVGTSALKDKYTEVTSLAYATKFDPLFYIDSTTNPNRVMIKPTPSASEPGYVTRVVIGTPADAQSSITNFPDNYVHLVVKYAAMRLLQAKIETLQATLPIDLDAAAVFGVIADMDLTTDLTNTTGLVYALSADLAVFHAYIETDEDIELASSKMSEIKLKFDMIKSELEDKMSKATIKERQLLGNISKDLQAFSAKMQKHMQEYQIYIERLKMVSAEYSSAFDAIGGVAK